MPANPLTRLGLTLATVVALMPLRSVAVDGISLVAHGPVLPVLPEPAPDTPPQILKAVQPEFPFPFILIGSVDLELIVDATGHAINPYIVRSTNPWLERPAIEAILQWTFAPAVKGGEPVAAKVTQRIMCDPTLYKFSGDGSPWQGRKEKGHKQLPDDLRWDEPPVALASAFPCFPRASLLAGTNGRASIRVRINPAGIVVESSVAKASAPEFGRAALAAIDQWRFKPAKRNGRPCSALSTMNFTFDTVPGRFDVPISYGTMMFARELRRKEPRFVEFAQLDEPPRAISRRLPAYPSSLRADGNPGKAEVEYFVDDDGDAQLPVVVNASRPEFGAAAVQAVSSWLFEPPLKHNRAVNVRCHASFSFFAPPGSDSPGETHTLIDSP